MAYAVFKGEEKLSRTFPTKEEALRKADEAGLVEKTDGEPVLEQGLEIKRVLLTPTRKLTRTSTGRLREYWHPLNETLKWCIGERHFGFLQLHPHTLRCVPR